MDCGCVPAGFLLLPATLFCSPRKLASVRLPWWQSFEPRFVGHGCMSAQCDVRKSVRRRTSGSNLSLAAFAVLRFLSGHSPELRLVYRHGRPGQRDRNAMVKTGRFPRTGFDQGVHKPGDEKSTCVRVIKGHHAQSPTVIRQATTTSFFSPTSQVEGISVDSHSRLRLVCGSTQMVSATPHSLSCSVRYIFDRPYFLLSISRDAAMSSRLACSTSQGPRWDSGSKLETRSHQKSRG